MRKEIDSRPFETCRIRSRPSRSPAVRECRLGKVITSHLIQQDSPGALLTFDECFKLLGLKEWPDGWELWKVGMFLDTVTSIFRRKGETWVRFHKKSILEEMWDVMIL